MTSCQDGGIGGYTLPPCTNKRTTTNIQTNKQKPHQNCQKIELYGSPRIKELKKKHSFRNGRRVPGNVVAREPGGRGSSWQTG